MRTRARELRQEVISWREQELVVLASDDGSSSLLRLRVGDGVELPKEWMIQAKAREYWGWWDGEQTEGNGDRWSIHLPEMWPRQRRWWRASMPTVWDGGLELFLVKPGMKRVILVGQVFNQGELCHWGASGGVGEVPDWPKLGEGSQGERGREELRRLGVLLRFREKPEGNAPAGTGVAYQRELTVAWGDRDGGFLGWEVIPDMGWVRELKPGGSRRFQALPDWERFEGRLRADSLGREV